MARMYGAVQGSRGMAHRLGASHLRTTAASWQGAVTCQLYVENDVDMVIIKFSTWHGAGSDRVIYQGPVSGKRRKRKATT